MVKTQGLRSNQVVKQETKCLASPRKSHHFIEPICRRSADENDARVSSGGVLLDSRESTRVDFADVTIKENFAGKKRSIGRLAKRGAPHSNAD
jgi:hypothetical protein